MDARALVAGLSGYTGSPWIAQEIYLIRSHLHDQPRYEAWAAGRSGCPRPPHRTSDAVPANDAVPDARRGGHRLPAVNRTTRWLLPAVLALLVVGVLLGAAMR